MTPSLVVVTIRERGRILHGLTGTRPVNGHRQWSFRRPHSHRENKAYQNTLPAGIDVLGPLAPRRGLRGALRPEDVGYPDRAPSQRPVPDVRDGRVRLTADVIVSWPVMSFVLDALSAHDDAATAIDLDLRTLQRIAKSPLASRIRALGTLDPDRRRPAESALCSEIVQRCSSV